MEELGLIGIIAFVFYTSLSYAAPLIFTGLGAVFSERSGVTNIGLEGIMQIGAFTGIITNLMLADTFKGMTPWVAIIIAMVIGSIFSLLLAVSSVTFRSIKLLPEQL